MFLKGLQQRWKCLLKTRRSYLGIWELYYLPSWSLHFVLLIISLMKKCRWKKFYGTPFCYLVTLQKYTAGRPKPFYVRLKTINVRWFMSVTQIETETIKCFLIVLLKKYVKANDISPGQFITYLLLSRPGTALQVDIRSWSLFVFLKMLYHWKYAVFVSTKNQLYCHFLWLSCQWWHIFFLSLPNQHFLQTRFA